ncbi:hypothetical protein BHE74_00008681 [Ensete ventricosum]|nr:hypothetical protein BHE74_00008681 [Ensete ventricosum]
MAFIAAETCMHASPHIVVNQSQLRFTGSKLATATTAPTITTSTTPPATMLRRKFLSDGETPGCAASATSGISNAAANAAVASPLIAFSFADDARTLSWLLGRHRPAAAGVGRRTGSLRGWKNASEPARGLLRPTPGIAMVTAKADAIDVVVNQLIHPTCRILIAGEMDKVIFFFLGGETKPEDKVVRALPLLLNLPAVLGGADRVFTVSISRLLPLPFISSESDKPIHRNHPSMLLLDNEKCLNHSERAQEDEQFLLPWR